MSGRVRMIAGFVLGLFFAGAAVGDTLELKDGRVLQGRYLGGTQVVLRFEIDGDVKTFNVNDAVAVTFTGNSGKTSAPAAAPPAAAPAPSAAAAPPVPADAPPPPPADADTSAASATPPADISQPPITSQDVAPPAANVTPHTAAALNAQGSAAQDPAAQYGEVTIPAGQVLLVRMIDGVDSSRNNVGDVFHASLETDLYINNTLLARKGTDVYGRLAKVQEAGKLAGSAELELELMRIVIDDHDYPIVSSD